MKKSTLVWIALAVVVILAVLWASSPSKSAAPTTETNTAASTASVTGSSPAPHVQTPPPPAKSATGTTLPTTGVIQSKSVTVSISNMAFSPSNISIEKGTTVIWTNHDSIAHTVTAPPGGPSSATLQPGQSYSFTFTIDGAVNYHCTIHPGMTGTVQVVG